MLERIWRKGNTPALLVGMHNGAAAMKTVWRFLQKLKLELAWNLAIPHLGIYPDKALIQKDTHTPVFTKRRHGGSLNVCQQMDGQGKCCTYIHECYSAIKKNEIMPFVATWTNLEIILLSEVSQKEKDNVLSLISRI